MATETLRRRRIPILRKILLTNLRQSMVVPRGLPGGLLAIPILIIKYTLQLLLLTLELHFQLVDAVGLILLGSHPLPIPRRVLLQIRMGHLSLRAVNDWRSGLRAEAGAQRNRQHLLILVRHLLQLRHQVASQGCFRHFNLHFVVRRFADLFGRRLRLHTLTLPANILSHRYLYLPVR